MNVIWHPRNAGAGGDRASRPGVDPGKTSAHGSSARTPSPLSLSCVLSRTRHRRRFFNGHRRLSLLFCIPTVQWKKDYSSRAFSHLLRLPDWFRNERNRRRRWRKRRTITGDDDDDHHHHHHHHKRDLCSRRR